MNYSKQVIFMSLIMVITFLSVKGDLKITPSDGSVAVFYPEDQEFVLKCTSNPIFTKENNITWELPVLYFAELLNYYVYYITKYNYINKDCVYYQTTDICIGIQ